CFAVDQDLKALDRHPGKSFAWCRAFSADSDAARAIYRHYHGELIAPTAEFTRGDVMATFRRLAKPCHPDPGGNSDTFRRLVEARDRALAMAGTVEHQQ